MKRNLPAFIVFFAFTILLFTANIFTQDNLSNRSTVLQKRSSILNKISGIEYVNGHEAAANQVIVKFKKNFANNSYSSLDSFNLQEHRILDDLHIIRSKNISTSELINRLSTLPEIESVYPDYILRISARDKNNVERYLKIESGCVFELE